MRYPIVIISIFLFIVGQIQGQTMETINVKGVLMFPYVQDPKMENFYCSLNSKIIINGEQYDFLSSDDINNGIIRNNKELKKYVGDSFFWSGDFYTIHCLYDTTFIKSAEDARFCDSVLNEIKKYNIYDKQLFLPLSSGHLRTRIESRSIFENENKDTIYIMLNFKGTLIKYCDVAFGPQFDSRFYEDDNGFTEFDDSHSICPFEKLESTFFVLHRTKKLKMISKSQSKKLKLKKSKITHVTIFQYI